MSITQANLDSYLKELFRDVDAPISPMDAEKLIGQKVDCDGRVSIVGPLEDGTWTMMIAPALGTGTRLNGPAPPPAQTYVIRKEFAQHIEREQR